MLSLKKKPDDRVSSKELVNRWKARITNSEFARHPQENNWQRWLAIVDDNLWLGRKMSTGEEPTQVNLLKSTIMQVLPHVLLEPPVIDIRSYAADTDSMEIAFIYERVAEYLDKQLDLFDEFKLAAYDAFLLGNGILKIGYWGDVGIGTQPWGSGLTVANRSAMVDYSSLFEIYPDFSAKRWKNLGYVIQQSFMHIDEIKSNDGYKKRMRDKLEPTATADKVYAFQPPNATDNEEYVLLQEVNDFRGSRTLVLSPNLDDALYEGPQLYGINPYENLSFWPRPRNVWGDSISQSIEAHIKELSETSTYLSKRVALEGLLKIFVAAGSFSDEEVKRLKNKENEVFQVAGDLSNSVHVVDFGLSKAQYSFGVHSAFLLERIRELSGVTQQELGIHESGVETKFEANMLKEASSVRNAMRKRLFSRFASSVITKLLYVVSLEYPPVQIAQMAGLGSEYAWLIEKAGPFDASKYEVRYGMTAANSRQERIQKLMIFRDLVGPNVNPIMMAKMVTDALDFEFTNELMVYQMLAQGGQGGAGGQPAMQAAQGVAQTRVAGGQQQQSAGALS